MSIFNKMKNWISPDGEYLDEDDNQTSDVKVVLYEPRIFSDSEIIGKKLKEGDSVVVNFQRIAEGDSQRTLDFLSGVLFSLDGEIHKIGKSVYLLTPKGVPVQGLIEELTEKG